MRLSLSAGQGSFTHSPAGEIAPFPLSLRIHLHRKSRSMRPLGALQETLVKKKIRAIQYGIGPIGASIAKLMREKQAIEIIGAIDLDPAKAGRDLGEVAGAQDAP